MSRGRLAIILPILFVVFCAPLTGLALSNSQDEPTDDDAANALTGPGDPQSHLAATVGEWELTIRIWTHPESEPVETQGSATANWILGDHFVETRLQGEVLDSPFEALRIEGYDAAAERFVSTWRDSRGTYTLVFSGKCDATCGIRTMTADFTDPVSKTELGIKSVTTIINSDSYTHETYIVTPDGTELKNMELQANRKP